MLYKRLTPIEVAEQLATKTGLSVEQVKAVLRAQAEFAIERADEGVPIPGIGVFLKVKKPARNMTLTFGPDKGKDLVIPAKQQLKFRISAIAKRAALEPGGTLPDLFVDLPIPEFHLSTASTHLPDPSDFIQGFSSRLENSTNRAPLMAYRLPDLWLPSGQVFAADLLLGGTNKPFTRAVPPGSHSLGLVTAQLEDDVRIAFAVVRFSAAPVQRWEMAVTEDQDVATLDANHRFGYGVDSATGCFGDPAAQELIHEIFSLQRGFDEQIRGEMDKSNIPWVHIGSSVGSVAVFFSGYGDGLYSSYFGLDRDRNVAALVTDFEVVKCEWPVS